MTLQIAEGNRDERHETARKWIHSQREKLDQHHNQGMLHCSYTGRIKFLFIFSPIYFLIMTRMIDDESWFKKIFDYLPISNEDESVLFPENIFIRVSEQPPA